MAIDLLEKEVAGLPEEKVMQIVEFARFIRMSSVENRKKTPLKNRKPGLLEGNLIYLADDFDETPECFKEYM